MATFSSNLYLTQLGTAGQSLNVGTRLSRDVGGKLRVYPTTYYFANTEANGDFINLCILKPGERVDPVLSRIYSPIVANSVMTLTIGDASDVKRYANTLTLSNTTIDANFISSPGTDAYVPTSVTVAVPPASATDQTVVRAKVTAASPSITANTQVVFRIVTVSE